MENALNAVVCRIEEASELDQSIEANRVLMERVSEEVELLSMEKQRFATFRRRHNKEVIYLRQERLRLAGLALELLELDA